MRILPKLFSLPVIIIAAWVGANIYHGNDLFANPFKEQSVLEKMESRGTDFFEDSIEDASDAAKDKFKEGVDGFADKLKDVAEEF
jgi:hypothetical protein